MIIIVFGLPGTGKTTFAQRLAQATDFEHISSDEIRAGLRMKGQYDKEAKEQIYEEMIDAANLILKMNRCVIVDGTFYLSKLRGKFKEYAKRQHKAIIFIEMKAEESDIYQRVNRRRPFSEADFDVYQKVKVAFEPMKEEHLIFDTSRMKMDEMIKTTINYLNIYRNGKTAYHRTT